MRYRAGSRHIVALVAGALLVGGAAHASAATVHITEAQSTKFPERAFVVSLPQKQSLSLSNLHVTENGKDVLRPTVIPGNKAGGRSFGVVLAIDSSLSMHGQAIDDAMQAARTFAGKRNRNLQIGVVFFNRNAAVALPLTTDSTKIDAALAGRPRLHQGTRIYDATAVAIRQLVDS